MDSLDVNRKRVLDIFRKALQQSEATRDSILDEECGTDASLRDQVELRLRKHRQLRDRDMSAQAASKSLATLAGTLGQYEPLEQIGAGTMGVVTKCRDPFGRIVAIKSISQALLSSPEARIRFEIELKAIHALRHRGIVTVYGVYQTDGLPSLVMEYIDGGTLASKFADGPKDPRWTATVVAQLADAAHHAHESGIVHRDLTPKNVLLTVDDQPKIADFGVAAVAREETRITATGALLGTPAYMAPEQTEGATKGIDGRVDVYALGVILYEALTGQLPFKGGIHEILQQVKATDPVPLHLLWPAVPRDLETICLMCLQKSPAHRYSTAAQLAEDLRRWLDGRPVAARPLGPARRLYRLCRRKPVETIAALTTILLIIGGPSVAAWIAWQRSERLAASDRSVNPALQEVFRGWGQAKASAVDDLSAWETTGLAAEHLERLVSEREVDRVLAEQVRQTLRDFRQDERDARERAEGARRKAAALARDRQFIVDLEEVRIRAPEDSRGFSAGIVADRQFGQLFARNGLNVLTMSKSEAASRILERSNPAEIAAMLDAWAIVRAPDHKWSARDLLALATEIDRDPFRTDIRLALHSENLNDIRQLADRKEAKSLPLPTIMLLAESLLTIGDAGRAAALLGPRQRSHPNDFWVNYFLGKAYSNFERPNWSEAARCFSAAAAIRSESPATHLNLGYAFSRNGNLGEAREAFRTAARLAPNDSAAHYHLGVVMIRLAQYESGVEELRTAIRLAPKNPISYLGLGAAHAEVGLFESAAESFREAVALAPDNYLAHHNLGEALRKLNDFDGAIRHLDESIRLKPNFPNAHRALGLALGERKEQIERLRPVASLGIALAFGTCGPIAVMPAIFAPSMLSAPDRNPQESLDRADHFSDGSAQQHFERGKRWYQRQRPNAAIAEFATAVDLDPELAEAHVFLALIYKDLERPEISISALRKANRSRPDDNDLVEALGLALARNNQADEAAQWFRHLVRRVPADGKAHSHLGKALLAAGSPHAAVEALKKSTELDPQNVEGWTELGAALRDCRRPKESLAAARRASELDPASPMTQLNLIVMLEDTGNVDEAISVATTLVRNQPLLPDARQALGYLLADTGRPSDAVKLFEAAGRLADDTLDSRYEIHRAIQNCKRESELEKKLAAVLRNETNLSPTERVEFAALCRRKGQAADAVRLYEGAFREEPSLADDVHGGHRFQAARAAAALIAGEASDEVESPRAHWAAKARTWLEADLQFWSKNIGEKTPIGRAYGYQSLKEWRNCRELRPMWSGSQIARLPGPERESWRKLGIAMDELWQATELRERPLQWEYEH